MELFDNALLNWGKDAIFGGQTQWPDHGLCWETSRFIKNSKVLNYSTINYLNIEHLFLKINLGVAGNIK